MTSKNKKSGPTNADVVKGYKFIVMRAGYLGGRPAFKNKRISVAQVLSALGDGMSAKELKESYGVTKKMIEESLNFAAQLSDEQKCG